MVSRWAKRRFYKSDPVIATPTLQLGSVVRSCRLESLLSKRLEIWKNVSNS
jgi:hypothetical protein